MQNCPRLESLLKIFDGVTDLDYLKFHYRRFCLTKSFVFESDLPKPEKILDIGAHWLHQAMFYALDGMNVVAADLPGTLDYAKVQKIAEAHQVALHSYVDLSLPKAFDSLPEDTFDLILFTEILEHITFNPVEMWKTIYRIMRPGGRIILTTPNYYYIKGQAWDFQRLINRMGSGIAVHEILGKFSNGPHWKEYSAREICCYFPLLSPDFHIHRIEYKSVPYFPPTTYFEKARELLLEKYIPILRNNIFVEISLPNKVNGITMQPQW